MVISVLSGSSRQTNFRPRDERLNFIFTEMRRAALKELFAEYFQLEEHQVHLPSAMTTLRSLGV